MTQVAAGISRDMFLSCNKYHMDLTTAKESNCKNKVHMVKTRYTVESKNKILLEVIKYLIAFSSITKFSWCIKFHGFHDMHVKM